MARKFIIRNEEEMYDVMSSLRKFNRAIGKYLDRLQEIHSELSEDLNDDERYLDDVIDEVNALKRMLEWEEEDEYISRDDIDNFTKKANQLYAHSFPEIWEREKKYKYKIRDLENRVKELENK